jgi:Tfp pilus assembly protein PilZ
MKEKSFIERRKEYRLPYSEKVILTDGKKSNTAYAANISRGGLFIMSLEPLSIDTQAHMAFCLPNQEQSFCIKAKVVHIIFDRQRCEVECGMGLQFLDLNESQKSILNLHILNTQTTYMELKKLLQNEKPDFSEIGKCLKTIPSLANHDLLALRYRVNRICTLFEPAPMFEGMGSDVESGKRAYSK